MRPHVQIQLTAGNVVTVTVLLIATLCTLTAVWWLAGPAPALLLALGLGVIVQGVRSLLTVQ